jgi:hypothetical protein
MKDENSVILPINALQFSLSEVINNPNELTNSIIKFTETTLKEAIPQFAKDITRFENAGVFININGEKINLIKELLLKIEENDNLKSLERSQSNLEKKKNSLERKVLELEELEKLDEKQIEEKKTFEKKINEINNEIQINKNTIDEIKFNLMIDLLVEYGITKEIATHITSYMQQGLMGGRANTLFNDIIKTTLENIDLSEIQTLYPKILVSEITINENGSISYKTSSDYIFDFPLINNTNIPNLDEYKAYSRLENRDKISYNTEIYFSGNSTKPELKIEIVGTGEHGNKIINDLQAAIPSAKHGDVKQILENYNNFIQKYEPIDSYKHGYENCLEHLGLAELKNIFKEIIVYPEDHGFVIFEEFNEEKFIQQLDSFAPKGKILLSDPNKIISALVDVIIDTKWELQPDNIKKLLTFFEKTANSEIELEPKTKEFLNILENLNDKNINISKEKLLKNSKLSLSFSSDDAAQSYDPAIKSISNIAVWKYNLQGEEYNTQEELEKSLKEQQNVLTRDITRFGDGGIYLLKDGKKINLIAELKNSKYGMNYDGMYKLLVEDYNFDSEKAEKFIISCHQGNFLGGGAASLGNVLIDTITNNIELTPGCITHILTEFHAIETKIENGELIMQSSVRLAFPNVVVSKETHELSNASNFIIGENSKDFIEIKIETNFGTVESKDPTSPVINFDVTGNGLHGEYILNKLKNEIVPTIPQKSCDLIESECKEFRHGYFSQENSEINHRENLKIKFTKLINEGLSAYTPDFKQFNYLESISDIKLSLEEKLEIFSTNAINYDLEKLTAENMLSTFETCVAKSEKEFTNPLLKQYVQTFITDCKNNVEPKTIIDKVKKWVENFFIKSKNLNQIVSTLQSNLTCIQEAKNIIQPHPLKKNPPIIGV